MRTIGPRLCHLSLSIWLAPGLEDPHHGVGQRVLENSSRTVSPRCADITVEETESYKIKQTMYAKAQGDGLGEARPGTTGHPCGSSLIIIHPSFLQRTYIFTFLLSSRVFMPPHDLLARVGQICLEQRQQLEAGSEKVSHRGDGALCLLVNRESSQGTVWVSLETQCGQSCWALLQP